MLKRAAAQRGLTLVELIVVMAIIALVLTMSTPTFTAWIQNTRLRASAESVLAGLQYARAEAVTRNTLVSFQFTSTLDDSCALDATSPNWVVNMDPIPGSVAGQCASEPDDTTAPFILRKHEGTAAPGGMVLNAGGVSRVAFNGLGRPTPPANVTIDLTNPAIGDCSADGGPVTCLRIIVSTAGMVRMCNPRFSLPDPQGC